MVILHVTLQVKPEHVSEFLDVVRYDAEHSEKDEPGCLRFDVSQELGLHAEVPIVAGTGAGREPGGDFLLNKKNCALHSGRA